MNLLSMTAIAFGMFNTTCQDLLPPQVILNLPITVQTKGEKMIEYLLLAHGWFHRPGTHQDYPAWITHETEEVQCYH